MIVRTESERKLHTCLMCETKIQPHQDATAVPSRYKTGTPTHHHANMDDCRANLGGGTVFPNFNANTGKVEC